MGKSKCCSHHNQGLRKHYRRTGAFFINSEIILKLISPYICGSLTPSTIRPSKGHGSLKNERCNKDLN